MSSGMNMEEAKKVADKMSYEQAVYNCLNAKCVPYRKATKIKMKELLERAKNLDENDSQVMKIETDLEVQAGKGEDMELIFIDVKLIDSHEE